MTWVMMTIVSALIAVAIGVQVFYLRGFARAGVDVGRATRVVIYVNVALLGAVGLGLIAYTVWDALRAGGM